MGEERPSSALAAAQGPSASHGAAVALEFKHNVCGREVYAEGTVDAALFLAARVAQGADQRLYDMVDVLGAGAMR